jgi:hypothetical protein
MPYREAGSAGESPRRSMIGWHFAVEEFQSDVI